MREMLGLIAAIIALTTAVLSLYRTIQQGAEIDRHRETVQQQAQAIEELRALASGVALDITIDNPAEGQVLPPVYDDMEGSFRGSIPPNHYVWVLAKDRFDHFLMYPPTQVAHAAQRWSQTNVKLPSPGDWQLALCLANNDASACCRNEQINRIGLVLLSCLTGSRSCGRSKSNEISRVPPRNTWPNPYEGGYAAARPCNGKEPLSVAGLSPLPNWALFRGNLIIPSRGAPAAGNRG
jgi:hypothetical protein